MENEENKILNEEKKELEVTKNFNSLENIENARNSKKKIYTNITDTKKIFNLENNVDVKLNDCEGECIRVKEILIKTIEKPMKNPIVDEETGEVIQDTEYKKVSILIDDEGVSYVTASKMFTNQLISYLELFGFSELEEKGVEIKIIKRQIKNSVNKALGFELL